MSEDWKDKLGVMFGVDPESVAADESVETEKPRSVPNNKQQLYVEHDRKGRKGKSATLITGFEGNDEELNELAAELKKKCGVGGSARGGEILIQGNFVQKIMDMLQEKGYKVKRIGG
ncbi:MAG: translation initiation factor [Mangrovibacterium sp.]